MPTHLFGYTGTAYDACQCDENIKNGDVLVIEDEKVVGLAWTWPIAITEEAGHLHWIDNEPGGVDEVLTDMGCGPDVMLAALAIAEEKGWQIRANLIDWKAEQAKV